MGLFSYVKPKKGKKDDKAAATQIDGSEKTADLSTPKAPFGTPGFGTPGSATPGNATPWGSRPASIYPVGDFRNSQSENINEIKCDVMVNWLYQQQMERLWTAGGHDEGVVLKRSKAQYTCCPADIIEEPYGFFKAVETLNVRVRSASLDNTKLNNTNDT